jgi:hypothetical protein
MDDSWPRVLVDPGDYQIHRKAVESHPDQMAAGYRIDKIN